MSIYSQNLFSVPFKSEIYLNRYVKFIEACNEKNTNPSLDVYSEKHHILPKSMFPKYSNPKRYPWNEVVLTAREHFIAHLMLWKAYRNHPMTHAANMMCSFSSRRNSRLYESLRRGQGLILKGTAPVKDPKDESQKIFFVSLEDPRYVSGELVSMHSGTKRSRETRQKMSEAQMGWMTYKDANGKGVRAEMDDPRILSGELTSYSKGTTLSDKQKETLSKLNLGSVIVRSEEGTVFRTSVDDPDYISGKLVHVNKGKIRSKEVRRKMSEVLKGTMTYKNKQGETIRLHKDDPKVLSGEYFHVMKGTTQSKEFVKHRLQKIKTNKCYITPFGLYGRLEGIEVPLGISRPTVIGMCKKSKEKINFRSYHGNRYLRENFPDSIIDRLTYGDLCFDVVYFDREINF